ATLDLKGLGEIPNVGKSTAEKIIEYLGTGRVEAIEKLRAKIPAGVREMTAVAGLGPKKALVLYTELGIASVDDLEQAVRDGKLDGLRGFGKKTGENILHGIELLRRSGGRVLISDAMTVAESIVAALSSVDGCVACSYAGSLRRMRESIGDVDILAAAEESKPLMAAFTALPLLPPLIA